MTRPHNILILCTDEFRGDMLAANGLNPDIRTPHMDALAARGVNFRRHFTTLPKCVPARVSMMSGRYTHTDGYRTITQMMPQGTPDLASSLQARGYQLAEFGRNHCWENMLQASSDPPQLEPGQRGLAFDHHAWTRRFIDIWEKHKAGDASIEPVHPLTLDEGRGLVRADDHDWSGDLAVVEMGKRFLAEVRGRDRPFFCQVNIGKPHPPYCVSEPWFSMYDRDTMRRLPCALPRGAPRCAAWQREVRTGHDCPEGAAAAMQSTYMAMCTRVDELIGELVATIDEQALWDDTVVVLTSDHGDYAGQYGLPEKWDNHFPDCLMHVPMAIVGPGLPVGRGVDTLTDHTDLAPTLCELVGAGPVPGVHGVSMLPAVDGGATRDAVFADGGHEAEMRGRFDFYDWNGRSSPPGPAVPAGADGRSVLSVGDGKQETYRLHPDAMARAKMVRTARWKYVHRETGDHELYDLEVDRWEMDNLYPRGAHAEVMTELRGRLLDWTIRTDPDRPRQPRVGA